MRRARLYCVHHPQELIKAADEAVKNQNRVTQSGRQPWFSEGQRTGLFPSSRWGDLLKHLSQQETSWINQLDATAHPGLSEKNLFFHNMTYFMFFCQRDLSSCVSFHVRCVVLLYIVLVDSFSFLSSGQSQITIFFLKRCLHLSICLCSLPTLESTSDATPHPRLPLSRQANVQFTIRSRLALKRWRLLCLGNGAGLSVEPLEYKSAFRSSLCEIRNSHTTHNT